MSNVLGDLFQEIADAIRTKTGETDKLAPADFPAEILSIPNIVNGGGETEGNLKIATGSFVVSDENNVRQTITHGLEEKPDFVLVYPTGVAEKEVSGKTIRLMAVWGLNSRFTDVSAKGAFASHGVYESDDGTYKELVWSQVRSDYGMDNFPSSSIGESSPWIRTPNDTTFEVGANSTYLFFSSVSYYWIAMSGTGTTAQNAEDLSF